MASHCQPFEEKKNIKQTNDGLSPAIFGSRRLLTHPEKQSTSPPPEKMGERRYTEQEEALEIKSLRRIIAAYANYQDAAERDVKRYERSFKMLPPAHKELLFHLGLKYQRLRWCISMNASFIMNMLEAFEPPFDMSQSNLSLDEQHDSPKEDTKTHESSRETDNKKVTPRHCTASLFKLNVPPIDVDKVRCIVRNIVRDWGEEGQKERDECYKPILEELNRLFPNRSDQRPPSCLVPGAGLGRLALEISSLGFVSQGNEFSYYMLICSNFILNHTQEANEWTIYPWIHSNCNSLSDNDQLRPVSFPDIHPSSAGITEGFSMCAGDFVEVYSEESQESAWDAVVTCFFLDTAHNIVEYIEIISKVLKDGGVWINLGPLLYHFADSYGPDDDMSIELSLEDVKKVAYHYGFTMEVEKMIETTYTSNMKAMMQNRYHAAFWTMRKDASRSKACKPR
ncbi:carnosine N-methyltransferase isoform X4 [Sorghum bicolor]|uniref:carnosine N-methyltransferase isoform X4 n=1 Tax=Sorghum bicolor TaxID=4558 RepID=UPI000B4247CD|nr:carnosine N-methyltransferase isoform X4 [Sorghum bicolor]|eukprot:XP_021303567.1 carnosine N-methyltransferase isoform X4 [Sorghum bicolor]